NRRRARVLEGAHPQRSFPPGPCRPRCVCTLNRGWDGRAVQRLRSHKKIRPFRPRTLRNGLPRYRGTQCRSARPLSGGRGARRARSAPRFRHRLLPRTVPGARRGAGQPAPARFADRRGTIEPLLTVSTEDGEIGRRPLRVDIPPQQVEIPAVDPRDGEPAETALFDRPPMELFIDEAVVAPDGLLRVEGWVVCLVQIETVEVFVAGERIGQAEFGRVREDVEHVRPDYPNARFSGFKLVSDIGRLGA